MLLLLRPDEYIVFADKKHGVPHVDDVEGGTQMSAAGIVKAGDFLVGIGGQDLMPPGSAGGFDPPSFKDVVALLRACPRPSELRFIRPLP